MSIMNGFSFSGVIARLVTKLCEQRDLILDMYREDKEGLWWERKTDKHKDPYREYRERR